MSLRNVTERLVETGRRFTATEDGVSSVEYAFFMLISIAVLAALSFFTDGLVAAYQSVVDAIILVAA